MPSFQGCSTPGYGLVASDANSLKCTPLQRRPDTYYDLAGRHKEVVRLGTANFAPRNDLAALRPTETA
jgi:hypothetical protein